MSAYLEVLNDKQREAVAVTEGPVVVLAGAGSGKTKMLTTRVVHLIHQGVHPANILAVTFTNKAAREMKERVGQTMAQFGNVTANMQWVEPWMGFSNTAPEVSTFHSFCVKLLRAEQERAGFQRPFVIYDDSDQKSVLKKIIKQRGFSGALAKANTFQHAINTAKCHAWGPDDLRKHKGDTPYIEKIAEVYQEYQGHLNAADALDFGDLIVRAYQLLKNNPDICERYQERFQYIMVDEYQDTNRAQYLLISLLAAKYRNIFVVGDEDQSIYKWRGADVQNILDFQKEYPDSGQVKLEQNYRSTKSIIEAASGVINNNSNRYEKKLWTANDQGGPVTFLRLADEREEAEHIAIEIGRRIEQVAEYNYSDFAIFYRGHAQSRALEEALRRYSVPYRIVGGVGFYERKEIKDMLSYMRLLVNPLDDVSLQRVINEPARGIGKTTLAKLDELAAREKVSNYNAMVAVLREGREGFSAGVAKKLKGFYELAELLTQQMSVCSVSELYRKILEYTGYLAMLQADPSEEAKARIENLEELNTVILAFEEEAFARGLRPEDGLLSMFLNQISLETSTKTESEDEQAGSVSLMTMHSAKGLEFPVAFIVGCEEGVFPSRRAVDESHWDEEIMEEERRLCYVGMTRAMRELTMTAASQRRIYGQTQIAAPSRFISEIPKDLLQYIDRAPRDFSTGSSYSVQERWQQHKTSSFRQKSSSSSQYAKQNDSGVKYDYSSEYSNITQDYGGEEMRIGRRVRHPVYGEGVVRKLEGSETDRKVTIEFAFQQNKKFHLKYVELELMD